MWAFQELGDYRDSKEKASISEMSWRKSVSDIVEDSFAYAKSAGFEYVNCEASRYGAYIDPNGNIQDFFSKYTDTTDEVDAEHGKVCDIVGLYDDGYLYEFLSFKNSRQEIENNVIQAFKTCEGYVYLKNDGTIGSKKLIDERDSYSNLNNKHYIDWANATQKWDKITKLVYYSDNSSEILIGIKADGTILVDGNIVNFDVHNMDFSNINNAIDASISIEYYSKDYPNPSNVMVAILQNDGNVQFNLFTDYGDTSHKTIAFNNKIIDCAFTIADNSLKLLCSDGYVYGCSLDDMTTYKMNIGGNIVYIESYLAITKNGEPRFFRNNGYDQCLPDSFKTRMYDEFIERIN